MWVDIDSTRRYKNVNVLGNTIYIRLTIPNNCMLILLASWIRPAFRSHFGDSGRSHTRISMTLEKMVFIRAICSQSVNIAMKKDIQIPVTIPTWGNEPTIPRILVGDISNIYVAEDGIHNPAPNPVKRRPKTNKFVGKAFWYITSEHRYIHNQPNTVGIQDTKRVKRLPAVDNIRADSNPPKRPPMFNELAKIADFQIVKYTWRVHAEEKPNAKPKI